MDASQRLINAIKAKMRIEEFDSNKPIEHELSRIFDNTSQPIICKKAARELLRKQESNEIPT
jgi:outer membrane lipopolysaccharide assembly protein LptE/RlpB